MNKAWRIARREFASNIIKPSFLFGAFGVPLIIIVIMVVVIALAAESQENLDRVGDVGYVDQSGVLADAAARPETFLAFQDAEAARAALEAQRIGAYFVLEPNYVQTGTVRLVSRTSAPDALKDEIDAFLIANLARDLDPEQVERLIDPIDESILTLDSGRQLSGAAFVGLFIVPFIFVFVFLLASQTTSGYLMSGVVEEKNSRIMEILVTTVTPFQLMFGKIIGLGALGLVQLIVWLAAGYLVTTLGQGTPVLAGVTIPPDLLAIGIVYFILGYFLMAGIMAGIGAVVGSEQESRQYAGLFTLPFSIPFFLIVSFFTDPDGPIVTFLCLFPFTSPVSVIMRSAFSAMPPELLALSMTILLITTLVVIWLSSRIFRWGLLLYGKRPSLGQIVRAVRRRSSSMATTAAAPVEAGGR
ncbi:MAG: ABC transporter permease [bacterium]|nr:ABC transporter permease [bacterium]